MKKIIIMAVTILITLSVFADITKTKLSEREQFAAEVVSNDEEFLMDYVDQLPEDKLFYFFNMAIDMAVEVAAQTKNMESDDEAYRFIVRMIDGEDGVKEQILVKVHEYLHRDDEETAQRFAKIVYNEDMYNHYVRFSENIRKNLLQRSVF
jgi:hypothetical protein